MNFNEKKMRSLFIFVIDVKVRDVCLTSQLLHQIRDVFIECRLWLNYITLFNVKHASRKRVFINERFDNANVLQHCSQYQMYQTRRHVSYDSLQSMLISFISFHIIIMNFIFVLFLSRQNLNIDMLISCKFFKRVIIIVDKKIWFVEKWNVVLLNRLNIVDWNLSKIIIFDRDRKFFFDMWTIVFEKLKMKFMYSTIYHFQIDDQNERINQTIEIVFRFHFVIMKNFVD